MISKNLVWNIKAVDEIMAIKTAIPKITLIGIPTTSKLKEGIVFIIIPNIISESNDSAINGKAIVKPIRKIFFTAIMEYSK